MQNEIREFRCKLCGHMEKMFTSEWKKKPQKEKRICSKCINARKAAEIDRRQLALSRMKYF